MIHLGKALKAWRTPAFKAIVQDEIEHLEADQLPLQQALAQTSYATGGTLGAVILDVTESAGNLRVKAGLFHSGIIAGCSCADDPTPLDEITEYCELLFDIDKQTAATRVTLLAD